MGWSTRELAGMADTTVSAVRHYHDVGLLDQPRRLANGYKVYERAHLDRLLHILRMRDVGLPLPMIAETLGAEVRTEATTQQLVGHIDAAIHRLQTARADLVASSETPDDHWRYPSGFADLAPHLSESDRLATQMMARHYSDEAMASLRSINQTSSPIDEEFARLPADATDAAIEDIAARLAPVIADARARHPMPDQVLKDGDRSRSAATRSIGKALTEVYNPAQLRATQRALELGEAES